MWTWKQEVVCYDRRYRRTFIPGMMVTFEKHHLCMPCKRRSGEKSEISATLNFWQLVIYLQKDRLQVGSWVFDRSSRWEKSARDAAGNLQSEVAGNDDDIYVFKLCFKKKMWALELLDTQLCTVPGGGCSHLPVSAKAWSPLHLAAREGLVFLVQNILKSKTWRDCRLCHITIANMGEALQSS